MGSLRPFTNPDDFHVPALLCRPRQENQEVATRGTQIRAIDFQPVPAFKGNRVHRSTSKNCFASLAGFRRNPDRCDKQVFNDHNFKIQPIINHDGKSRRKKDSDKKGGQQKVKNFIVQCLPTHESRKADSVQNEPTGRKGILLRGRSFTGSNQHNKGIMRKVIIRVTANVYPETVMVGDLLEADYNELRNIAFYQPPFTDTLRDQLTFQVGENCEIASKQD